jgi:hypothetical protein
VRAPLELLGEERARCEFPYPSLVGVFEGATEFLPYFEDDLHRNDKGAPVAAQAKFTFCVKQGCFP